MQTVVTRAALAAFLFLVIGSHVGYGLTPAQAQSEDTESLLSGL